MDPVSSVCASEWNGNRSEERRRDEQLNNERGSSRRFFFFFVFSLHLECSLARTLRSKIRTKSKEERVSFDSDSKTRDEEENGPVAGQNNISLVRIRRFKLKVQSVLSRSSMVDCDVRNETKSRSAIRRFGGRVENRTSRRNPRELTH